MLLLGGYMLENLRVGYLTGAIVSHEVPPAPGLPKYTHRPYHSIGQIFFKPYESSAEFELCVEELVLPTTLIVFIPFIPASKVVPPMSLAENMLGLLSILVLGFGLLLISGVNKCIGNEELASWWLAAADKFFCALCQAIIDLTVWPLAVLILITRSTSTILKNINIYNYDAPNDDTPQVLKNVNICDDDAPNDGIPQAAAVFA